MRDILEENGYSLFSSTHLRHLVLFIHKNEMSLVQQEISGRHVSLIIYGTTHVVETFVVTLRYIDDQWNIQRVLLGSYYLPKFSRRSSS